jgi:hypothetical protein
MTKQGFNMRSFVSMLTLAGFLIMGTTGIILFITPAGRIAYWTNWTFAGLTKTQWGNIHIVSSLVFVAAGIVHTWLNWKPLKGYLSGRAHKGFRLSWEMAIAGLLALFLVFGAALEIPPLNSLLNFNASVKDSWIVEEAYEPPFGHAEMLSLKGFAKKQGIDISGAVETLQSQGIKVVSVDDAMEKIAQDNATSPMELYRIIKHLEKASDDTGEAVYTTEMIEERFAGTGIGQKTLVQVCEQLGLDYSIARKRLGQKGIKIGAGEKIKDSAERYDMNPLDLLKIALVE